MTVRDDAQSLLSIRAALAEAARDTGLDTRPPRRLARGTPASGSEEAVQVPYDPRSPFDPEAWEGVDPVTQALLDGEKPAKVRKHRGTAAYYSLIGPPPNCGPGEVGAARVYLAKVLKAIELGGWTHSEYVGLKKLEGTWRARATGRDARFLVVGNYQGRLPRDQERRIWDMKMAQRRGV